MSQPDGDGSQPIRGRHRPSRRDPTKRLTRRRWSWLRRGAGVLVVAVLGSMFIKAFILQSFFIPSASMEPALHGCPGCFGDRVLVSKVTKYIGGVHRGDIVVFRDPGGWLGHGSVAPRTSTSRLDDALVFIGLAASSSESDFVKRVVGIGGDTVEGRAGKVYVNGTQLVEPYVFPSDSATEIDFKVTVPGDNLWVMGDHRSDSADSRLLQQAPGKGFVPLSDVVGRAFVIIGPRSRIGLLDRPATFDLVAASTGH
ncbi:MAG: signal peptidase I [Actinomycetota bacterium]